MNKKELKEILKPLIKECIRESLEEGLLSGIIKECVSGLVAINEAKMEEQTPFIPIDKLKRVNTQSPAQFMAEARKKEAQDQKKLPALLTEEKQRREEEKRKMEKIKILLNSLETSKLAGDKK